MVALEEKDSMRPVVIKPFKPELDSLMLSLSPKNLNVLHFHDTLKIESNLPIMVMMSTYKSLILIPYPFLLQVRLIPIKTRFILNLRKSKMTTIAFKFYPMQSLTF